LLLERGALRVQLSETSEIGAGEIGSHAGQTIEETGDRRAVAGRPGEVRDLALVAGGQHDQSIALTASVALWVSIPIVTIAGPPSRG
jgi:hypothetical protein